MRSTAFLLVAGAVLALASSSGLAVSRPAELAVTAGPGPPHFNADLWIVQGHLATRIVATKRKAVDEPSWSPDGKRLAFTVIRDPVLSRGTHVFIAERDGSHEHRLTHSPAAVEESGPAWSPDGRTIAFSRRTPGAYAAIWLVRANGRAPQRLTSGSSAAWSPDGARLVFSSAGVLWTIRRDGTGRAPLTTPPIGDPSCDFSQGDFDGSPEWSPRGNTIAFVRYCGTPEHTDEDAIYAIQADGSDLRPLTSGPGDDFPSWASDGRSLAFIRSWKVDIVGRSGGTVKTLYAPRRREVYDVAWRR